VNSREGHPDSTVSDEEWRRVIHSAAHTFEGLPTVSKALDRAMRDRDQRNKREQS
jgi:hypothetical protein